MSDENTQAPEEQKDVKDETVVEDVKETKEETATKETAQESTEETQEEAPAKTEEAAPENPGHAYKTKLVDFDDLKTGQTVRVHERIKDISPKGEERERIQVFEGMILAFGGKGITRTITVRKATKGFGVEKIYPINSPVVAKFELIKSAKVRQAKLGYLKNLKKRFKRKLRETHTELGKQSKKKKR